MTSEPGAEPPPVDPGSEPGVELLSASFTVANVSSVRHQLRRHAAAAGATGDDLDDFVLAVHELVTNAVRHGGGSGRLCLRRQADTLCCEVRDEGGMSGMLRPHLPAGDMPGGRGLWLAQQLTAGLTVSAGPVGVNASVIMCLTSVAALTGPSTSDAVPDARPYCQSSEDPARGGAS
ncbi:ATP-binding protein [Actinoplanes sp. NPDC020271]|uniref:ATP-binding protein n=1 Tax=Actinoplanes sp. NPDC020271 TaxID=3363896 RepID=UPI0037B8A836